MNETKINKTNLKAQLKISRNMDWDSAKMLIKIKSIH